MSNQNQSFLIIGSIKSRKVKLWTAALNRKGFEAALITYDQVIANDFPEIINPTSLRITSPGEDFDLYKKILTVGTCPNATEMLYKKGLIYPNPYWYKGWCVLLDRVELFIKENPLVKVMNSPASIKLAFHKLDCQKFLAKQGISTPQIILDKVSDYDALIAKMEQENIPQVFVKPYHGSSASGVMALRQSKGRQMLYTTIALQSNGEMYNHLQLQKYNSISEIRTIVNQMIPSNLLVEQWIKKKRFFNKSVDFRVLIINGKAAFVVPRLSPHFITNLHLGNEKGDLEELEVAWGQQVIEEAKELAVKAANTIEGLFYAGVDVAISTSGRPYILEINAFGDLLLNIFRDGKNTFEYGLGEYLDL